MAKGINPLDHALVAELHPPMYFMHAYWARKPYNVVAENISRYSDKEDIILDPFCGSGIAPIEAVNNGYKSG